MALDLNRLRPRPSHLITYEGESFLVADLQGFIGGGIEGFYFRQTRFLSKFRFAVDGQEPRHVSANEVNSYSAIAYFLAHSPAGGSAGPQCGGQGGGEMVQHGIELQLNTFVGAGLHLDVHVTNHALAPTRVILRWELDADFADRAEAEQGERQQNAPIERRWRLRGSDGELSLRYCHEQLRHATEIRFSGSGGFIEDGEAVSCILDLRPQRPVSLGIDVVPIFCGEGVGLRHGRDAFDDPPAKAVAEASAAISTSNAQMQRIWDRAVSDLVSLALLEGEREEKLTPAGGVPRYLALFGRDVLMTSFQACLLAPAMLRGSLRHIARWNAAEYDERYDQEPGRVIHQREQGPLSLLQKNPFLHYYGDYSAPGLFLINIACDLAITGDKEFFLSMQDKMLATLEWMDRQGDGDGDGFYEYETKAGAWGEKNQGWKDSSQAILYQDGRLVENPIALVEIQGCYFAAKQLLGLAFASVGDERRATALLDEAARLKRRFNETFWIPEERYFGLALDPEKKLVCTIAADPGQCLAYGIIDDDKTETVATRLMEPDFFSGWGIRTLSARHPAFNPFAYHLGSVWPVSNAMIGFGFKRYGFNKQLHRLAKAMFDVAQLFEHDRLPEVFGGQPRDRRHPHPGIYPDANSPQAWSAGAVMLLIQSLLGSIPVAPRQALVIDPDLPDWLPELTITGLRIGGAKLSLRLRRDASGYTHHEIIDRQGEIRIHRQQTRTSGSDRFAQALRELL